MVSRSTCEAEYRAIADATAEITWIQSLLKELGISSSPPAVLWCDNMGATSLALNPVFHARTKHIEVDVHFIRDKVIAKAIDVRFVPSEDQLADLLTKALPTPRFRDLCDKLTAVIRVSHDV